MPEGINSYCAEYKQRVYAGFFIVVCSLYNSLLVYFPDAAPGYIRALFACCETP